ncbi:hypothetical protein Aspvir_007924 [Aspergillus viridinutans]|uniref:Uncharacterized protein n=1 Tax=Aspergillus viridinutans TaxID=75553 RepID=A0A9P3C4M2_ASPVI|nr:uncharacterized protein Aspvir_007924 [Aspergillus viridinutans]GIK03849.1 hypothetical protein Aspvir_007924 [Aspergillus viridinutans]
MSKLDLKLGGWGEENQPKDSIDTDAPVSSESKPISRFDGHEFGYRYVGTTDYSQEKVFQILNDYLQPDTKTSLDSAVHWILALLPEKEPLSTEVWDVGEVVLQLAEQIPYHHPSQIKLARFMEELTLSPKLTTELSESNVLYMRGQRFKESLRDWYNGPGEDAPQEWPNLNAFFAHEASTHIRPHQPDFAIWTLRDAFENPAEPIHWSASFKGMRDQQIIAAAQYILWDGQELFKHVLCPNSMGDTKGWEPGLLYFGDASLSLKRWRFWKDRFRKAAGEDSGMSDECRNVSTKAATLMEALEASMIF